MIDWQHATVPVAGDQPWSLKDPALTFHEGWFQLACSAFYDANYSLLVGYRSRDLVTWEGPLWQWGAGEQGWCSPDIVQDGDRFIMTFQSWDGIHPRQSANQIFYAESTDACSWSAPKPLAAELTQGVRAIDAAVAHHGDTWYLIYKEAQTPRMAMASDLDGPWQLMDQPFEVWAENGQFLQIDGTWHLLATILNHEQGLTAMTADPNQPGSWTSCQIFGC